MKNVYVIKNGELYHAENKNISGRRLGNQGTANALTRRALIKYLAKKNGCNTNAINIVVYSLDDGTYTCHYKVSGGDEAICYVSQTELNKYR